MKKIIYSITFCFLTISIFSCEEQTYTPDDNKPIDNENTTPPKPEIIDLKQTTQALVASNNSFGFDIFSRLVEDGDADENIFISPTSIALALAMAYNGAEGDTKTEMETALHLSGLSTAAINATFRSLIDSLLIADEEVLLEIANAVFYAQGFPVREAFIDSLSINYDAEVSEEDFALSETLDIINNWVARNTNDKILEILDEIPADAVMYILNAIYFKATWKYEFDSEQTRPKPFTLQNGSSIQVPTMNIKKHFRYAENTEAEMLEVPYGDESYNMYIVLPKPGISVEQLARSLNSTVWNSLQSNLSSQEVILDLPKFTYEYKSTLNSVLQSMGMEKAFTPFVADFSNITDAHDLYISRVLHKTFVDVNEEGTEAAAVTVVEFVITSVGPEPIIRYFTVNRPFIYAIQEKSTGSVVFIGLVYEPEYE